MTEQTSMWESHVQRADKTPLEAGGAIVVIRLSPEELRFLRQIDGTDTTKALHDLIEWAIATSAEIAHSRRRPAQVPRNGAE